EGVVAAGRRHTHVAVAISAVDTIIVVVAGAQRTVAAELTQAVFRRVAGLTELEQTLAVAPVTGVGVPVVTSLTGLEHTIPAPGRDAHVRGSRRVAQITRRAIVGIVAGASAVGGIAEAAGALPREVADRAQLSQTSVVAAVARRDVPVIAAFAGFDDGVAAAGLYAGVRRERRTARLCGGAIVVRVARAGSAVRIA